MPKRQRDSLSGDDDDDYDPTVAGKKKAKAKAKATKKKAGKGTKGAGKKMRKKLDRLYEKWMRYIIHVSLLVTVKRIPNKYCLIVKQRMPSKVH
jgi:hypothetical protein